MKMKTAASNSSVRKVKAEELHKPVRTNCVHRTDELEDLHGLYQAELVEMILYTKVNKGYKYLMFVINAFSKFSYAVSLKTKTGKEVAATLQPILTANRIKYLQTDKGKEFYNSVVQTMLNKYGVIHYSRYSMKKTSIVGRYNRTSNTHVVVITAKNIITVPLVGYITRTLQILQ